MPTAHSEEHQIGSKCDIAPLRLTRAVEQHSTLKISAYAALTEPWFAGIVWVEDSCNKISENLNQAQRSRSSGTAQRLLWAPLGATDEGIKDLTFPFPRSLRLLGGYPTGFASSRVNLTNTVFLSFANTSIN